MVLKINKFLTASLFLGIAAMPFILLAFGSPLYTWRSFSDLSNFVTSNATSIDIIAVVIHVCSWITWSFFVAITLTELVNPAPRKGLGNRVLKRALVLTGLISLLTSIDSAVQPNTLGTDLVADANPGLKGSQFSDSMPELQRHLVQVGDSWLSLAEHYLGDPNSWQYLRSFNLNSAMVDGEVISEKTHILRPGWQIMVPVTVTTPNIGAAEDFEVTTTYENLASVIRSCLLYTSPSPRDRQKSRMPSSA